MSKIFVPQRSLGFVSNHVPLQVRYIKSRKENLIVTCVGKSFHTYGISHFGLLSVSGLHPTDIQCMSSDNYHVYTGAGPLIYAWRRGTTLVHTYRGHAKDVHLLLPFGVHLISIDEGNNLKIWDIKDETLYLELKFGDEFIISSISHPSTYINKILLGSEQGALQLWNINTAKLVYTFKGWNSRVCCISQAPAIDVVAIGLKNGKIVVHNLKYDETLMELTQDWGTITSISFRWDGDPIMAAGSTSGHVVFWDLDKRQVASVLKAHEMGVTGMECLQNEPLILTSSPDNSLKLWIFDMPDGGARLLRIREGHSSVPTFIRFHGSNGHNILSAGADSTLRIFNTRTEQFNKSLGRASYNRKASKKRKSGVEDPLIMPPIMEFTSETTREKEWDNICALHSDLSIVTTWSYDKLKMGDLKLLPTRFQKKNLKNSADVVASCLDMTKCGNFVLIGYNTGHVDRFNVQSGLWRCTYGTPKAHEGPIRGVATDALNQLVITGSIDGDVHFWRFKYKDTDAPLKSINLGESIGFFRKHNENSLIAIALEDFSICVLDLDSMRLIRKFSGHKGQITDITFNQNSRWIVSSSLDCTIKVWDLPSGQLIDNFSTETHCTSLNLSPSGETLATSHSDQLGVFLWINRTLYSRITLKSLNPEDEPWLITLPESTFEDKLSDFDDEFESKEQISGELVTLSGLSTSRWLNLLNLDVIKKRNKPKEPLKKPKLAPFFLPTIPSLSFQFDLTQNEANFTRKIITPTFTNLSEFATLLKSGDFNKTLEKLKSFGPSMIDFEIKSLSPEGGGSVELMLVFLKFIEWIFISNRDFELGAAYLGVFARYHGAQAATEECLRNYLPNLQSCHKVAWTRIQDKLLFSLCVIRNLKIS